ncbi:MAG: 3-oxoacyl-[acyl-carrier-protein] reductase [Gemmatimonadetes bacterium]|uniref:3-oxoacyl-[acyl-carrier-protein] reductase n=1 Tax=Candidatus Kutchimonas denitrificans TaxID=3056748 RepID=A0AAE4Z7I8_9BACT|nr:3-oxoacyl-[acyl-carrier-protein] reductase [Gemmatimonadota bacterium]NIR75230.1 3-oxoacyl-[acyl-carrier-protein] reductase [Candidatus Kutchimonas denitrificans]NIS00168.1 3-oxoacyl-[acyl-carrier-protein] reductase [Gemmatimonadota bacterium]NIT65760.1 3-oxoacyl-[acyl-carrier-protein] reductase [Gemmatimonadota bacterium]NIU53038.1 3-oxoacyl-[acyl-carrier-protein] reductase [Gemmatimonadota bacterium]
MKELEGAVAVITGGFRGIGLATAKQLADAGAAVAVLDMDESGKESAEAELPGGRAYICNVTELEDVNTAVDAVTEELGPITVLVNNAGVTRDNLLLRMKDDEWNLVLDVNLRGTFLMTRAVSKGMIKERAGSIVNLASVVGVMGNAGQANYASAKAGIIGFTKAVAKELAPRGVRANAVAPGFIDTAMTQKLPKKARETLMGQIPLGKLGEPEDVARVIRFLAGPASSYITGQVLVVDGGMVM